MLVLSRQRDETIMIGDDIEITVVDIRGDKVRLGITAPTRISVHRKEVYEAIKAENQKAAQINNADVEQLRRKPAAGGGMQAPRIAGLRPRPPGLGSHGGPSLIRPTGEIPPAAQGGAQTA